MTLDPETLTMLRALLLAALAGLAIAKISRQSSAEGLRRRLRTIEMELFEFARLGHIGFRDPAYLLLRNSLRSIAWASQDFSLTRAAVAVLRGHDIWWSANLQLAHPSLGARQLESSGVADQHIEADGHGRLHEHMLLTLWAYLALGAIPFAAWIPAGPEHQPGLGRLQQTLCQYAGAGRG